MLRNILQVFYNSDRLMEMKGTAMNMTEAQFQQFDKMTNELSPENLCCDGEISRAQANRRYRAIMVRWHKLEKEVGRKVTEEEIFTEDMKRYDEEQKKFDKKLVL